MLKRHNQLRNTFLRILDLLIAFSAWELAYLLRFHIIDWPPAIEIPSSSGIPEGSGCSGDPYLDGFYTERCLPTSAFTETSG